MATALLAGRPALDCADDPRGMIDCLRSALVARFNLRPAAEIEVIPANAPAAPVPGTLPIATIALAVPDAQQTAPESALAVEPDEAMGGPGDLPPIEPDAGARAMVASVPAELPVSQTRSQPVEVTAGAAADEVPARKPIELASLAMPPADSATPPAIAVATTAASVGPATALPLEVATTGPSAATAPMQPPAQPATVGVPTGVVSTTSVAPDVADEAPSGVPPPAAGPMTPASLGAALPAAATEAMVAPLSANGSGTALQANAAATETLLAADVTEPGSEWLAASIAAGADVPAASVDPIGASPAAPAVTAVPDSIIPTSEAAAKVASLASDAAPLAVPGSQRPVVGVMAGASNTVEDESILSAQPAAPKTVEVASVSPTPTGEIGNDTASAIASVMPSATPAVTIASADPVIPELLEPMSDLVVPEVMQAEDRPAPDGKSTPAAETTAAVARPTIAKPAMPQVEPLPKRPAANLKTSVSVSTMPAQSGSVGTLPAYQPGRADGSVIELPKPKHKLTTLSSPRRASPDIQLLGN